MLTVKKDKKLDSIKLSSEYRNDILTSILKYYKEFADKPKNAHVCCVYVDVYVAYLLFTLSVSFPLHHQSVSQHTSTTGLVSVYPQC